MHSKSGRAGYRRQVREAGASNQMRRAVLGVTEGLARGHTGGPTVRTVAAANR